MSTEAALATAFVVAYGRSGGVGCFAAEPCTPWPRGTQVVVQTLRGLEVGSVLCPANDRQKTLLPSPGRLLRCLTDDDRKALAQRQDLAQRLFDDARSVSSRLNLPLEILDVDILFSGEQALLQFVGDDQADVTPLISELSDHFGLEILLENLAAPAEAEHDHGGCGKPDCGKTDGGGGCTSCGTGGGCSSCGAGKVDMTAYFAHLRTQMETRRTPLA